MTPAQKKPSIFASLVMYQNLSEIRRKVMAVKIDYILTVETVPAKFILAEDRHSLMSGVEAAVFASMSHDSYKN